MGLPWSLWLLLVALYGHTNLELTYGIFVDQVTCDETMKECIYCLCLSCRYSFGKFTPSSDNNYKVHVFPMADNI